MHRDAGGQLWMNRPLPPNLLDYAANDIHAIRTLYEHFTSSGWIPPNPTSLLQASARYIALHHEPVDTDDPFIKGGPFLPLDILTVLGGRTCQCRDCHRQISIQHFTASPPKYTRVTSCRVCEALKAKIRFDERKAKEKEAKAARREEKARTEADAAARAQAAVEARAVAEAEVATAAKPKVQLNPGKYNHSGLHRLLSLTH